VRAVQRRGPRRWNLLNEHHNNFLHIRRPRQPWRTKESPKLLPFRGVKRREVHRVLVEALLLSLRLLHMVCVVAEDAEVTKVPLQDVLRAVLAPFAAAVHHNKIAR